MTGLRFAGETRLISRGAQGQAFEALRDAGVIDGGLCRRLTRAQKAHAMIEHSYVNTPAGDVHRAARLVHETAREFIGAYRDWIAPHLVDEGAAG